MHGDCFITVFRLFVQKGPTFLPETSCYKNVTCIYWHYSLHKVFSAVPTFHFCPVPDFLEFYLSNFLQQISNATLWLDSLFYPMPHPQARELVFSDGHTGIK